MLATKWNSADVTTCTFAQSIIPFYDHPFLFCSNFSNQP